MEKKRILLNLPISMYKEIVILSNKEYRSVTAEILHILNKYIKDNKKDS